MKAVKGTYQRGRVKLAHPVSWPDGSEVLITKLASEIGMTEEEWPTTPEGIAELVAQINSFEPVKFTPEEEKELAQFREAVRKVTLEAVRKKMGLDE